MNCPKCDGRLDTVVVDGVEVDQCGRCSGIWFDFGEIEKILTSADIEQLKSKADSYKEHDAKRGICPRCGGVGNMVQVTQLKDTDVHVDTCLVCYGQWLDGGELEKLHETDIASKLKRLFGLQ